MVISIIAPERKKGRPTADQARKREEFSEAVCARVQEIQSRLDFTPSARGWGYLMEGDGTITKGDLDVVETVINNARKSGRLPLDICADDSKRVTHGLEDLDEPDIPGKIKSITSYLKRAHTYYTPLSFWEDLPYYVEILVEKIDLIGLFAPAYEEFHVACTNGGGWSDLNSRAAIMGRFKYWNGKGKHCVLLPCGDHDVWGLRITESIRSNMAELKNAVGWDPCPQDLTIKRFGLNADFIDDLELPWIDGLETGSGKDLGDPRHPAHFHEHVQDYIRRYGKKKCEANALVTHPEEARELCRDAILEWIPDTAISDYEKRLDIERRKLRRALRKELKSQTNKRK